MVTIGEDRGGLIAEGEKFCTVAPLPLLGLSLIN